MTDRPCLLQELYLFLYSYEMANLVMAHRLITSDIYDTIQRTFTTFLLYHHRTLLLPIHIGTGSVNIACTARVVRNERWNNAVTSTDTIKRSKVNFKPICQRYKKFLRERHIFKESYTLIVILCFYIIL